MITLYHMICFTDFLEGPELITMVGYSLISMLAFIIVINLTIMAGKIIFRKLR